MRGTQDRGRARGHAAGLLAALVSAVLVAMAIAPAGAAAEPPLFWQSAIGQTTPGARGIAVSPSSGHVFVDDQNGFRIVELTAWGELVKMWGWDVVATGPGNAGSAEAQSITVKATSGTFTLSFNSQTTAPIAFDASAATVEAALDALSSIGGIGGSVAVGGGPGDASGSNPYTVTFGGALSGFDVAQIAIGSENLGVAVGTKLTCASTTSATTTNFQWLTNGAPSSGPGATSSEYETVAADAGKAVQCQIFKLNANAGSTQVSNPRTILSTVPSPPPPIAPSANIAAPTLSSGTLNEGGAGGAVLACNPGTWSGSPSFSYQWYRNGVALAGNGANTAEYTVQSADLTTTAVFQCAVTGSNASGKATKVSQNKATSAAPSPAAPPSNTGSPNVTVSGAPVSSTATLSPGVAVLEVCVPADGDVCKVGVKGAAGAGQFNSAAGLAVDPAGNVYAAEAGEPRRVQKFSPAGQFLLSFGGGVDQGPHHPGNLCTATYIAEGDICGAGQTGTGPSEFSGSKGALRTVIAITADGKVWVGDKERIQRFNTAGEFQGQINKVPEGVQQVAVDAAGFLYVSYEAATNDAKPEVRKLDPTSGAELCRFQVENPRAITVAPSGAVYVFDQNSGKILRFSSVCSGGSPPPPAPAQESFGEDLSESTGLATSNACGIPGVDLYATHAAPAPSFVRAYGLPPQNVLECPPPHAAPVIASQYATSVGTDSATVRAQVNPRFWTDATYYVQYGTADVDCALDPCKQALFPGAPLTAQITNSPVPAAADLTGLKPDTVYHFRFVAQSGGGGPVFGPYTTFTTYRAPAVDTGCSNQDRRLGPAAGLPDCRAYEMVSPVDKNGGDADAYLYEGLDAPQVNESGMDQSTPEGADLAYTASTAFADPEGAPAFSEYIASRGAGGWASESIDPPMEGGAANGALNTDSQFRAFSEDLCEGWLAGESGLPLTAGPTEGFQNLYRREDCAPFPEYTWLESSALAPEPCLNPACDEPHLFPQLEGISAEGDCAAFRVNDALTAEAPKGVSGDGTRTAWQLYLWCEGEGVRLVSVLPTGTPFAGNSSAGTENPIQPLSNRGDHADTVATALSEEGTRVYWTASGEEFPRLYLRVNADKEQSTSGCEPAKACTLAASPGANRAQFWTANRDDTRAIFSITAATLLQSVNIGNLYEYTYNPAEAKGEAKKIAGETLGVAGASRDATRVYFASREVCSAEPNSEDSVAEEGKPNLYLYEVGESCAAGEMAFVGTLAEGDVSVGSADNGSGFPSPLASIPRDHIARASSDGGALAFVSAASLTGYDSTDAASGEADREVYLYDASSGELHCASCNPSGARPSGADLDSGDDPLWTAAWIPGYQHQLYGRRPLSGDGQRLFFNSLDPLALRDVNGASDVYQWEAPGTGRCTTASPTFSSQNGGCVDLISSGQSPQDSEFVDASESGDDVFIRTGQSLLPQDPGSVDIYDARVEGGFPQSAEAAPCEGDSCQSVPPAPGAKTPASAAFQGPGNPNPGQPSCAKGKVRRHGRCVARKRHSKRHRRRHLGRAVR